MTPTVPISDLLPIANATLAACEALRLAVQELKRVTEEAEERAALARLEATWRL